MKLQDLRKNCQAASVAHVGDLIECRDGAIRFIAKSTSSKYFAMNVDGIIKSSDDSLEGLLRLYGSFKVLDAKIVIER